MTNAALQGQSIEQVEAGKLYEVDWLDPHGTRKGLVVKGDQSEYPKAYFVLPGTEVLLSEIPVNLQEDWDVGNNAFAISDETGFSLTGRDKHVNFDDLEITTLIMARAVSG